jgi:electron transfer flavoprotein alpha subunit
MLKASTLVVAEHEGGALKNSSLSAVAAAAALGEGSTVSLLVGGSGPLLQQAVAHAAKAHPAITQVHNLTKNTYYCQDIVFVTYIREILCLHD